MLDLLLMHKDEDGSVEGIELEDVEDSLVGELRELEREAAMLLAEEDVESIGAALEPGRSAAVLVWENTWAGPVWCRGHARRRAARGQRAHPHPGDPRRSRSRTSKHATEGA